MRAPKRSFSSSSRALQHLDREPTAYEADTSMEHLSLKLVEFITCMSQEIWELSPSRATEQAQRQEDTLLKDDFDDCIYEKISLWADRPAEHAFYTEPALLLHENCGI